MSFEKSQQIARIANTKVDASGVKLIGQQGGYVTYRSNHELTLPELFDQYRELERRQVSLNEAKRGIEGLIEKAIKATTGGEV